tara:strand:- start:477 stop:3572 length:3096 start_codon:yes stop_codon:yes gene_type:complete
MALRRPPTTFSDEITAGDLAANSVGASELADNAVDANAIAANAVTTAKIADSTGAADGITTAKLATNAVTSAKITDANITTAKLADNAITTAKVSNAVFSDTIGIKPHIQPGMLQPAIAGKLLDGTTSHSGAYGTAQSDGHSYYYTDIKGSVPIEDPRIGAHFGTQRVMFRSIQENHEQTAAMTRRIFNIDGRKWARCMLWRGIHQFEYSDHTTGRINLNVEESDFIEVTGYFSSANALMHAGTSRTFNLTLNGGTVQANAIATTTTGTPLSSRYVEAASVCPLTFHSSSTPILGINTLKIIKGTAGSQYIGGVELTAHGKFTDATCDTTSGDATVTHDANAQMVAGMSVTGTGIPAGTTIASVTSTTAFELSANASATNSNQTLTFGTTEIIFPAQNVVTYGRKHSISATAHHYNPFATAQNGAAVVINNSTTNTAKLTGGWASGGTTAQHYDATLDTATSLGLAAWVSGGEYFRPVNGGRVVKWIDSTGAIKTSVNMVPPAGTAVGGVTSGHNVPTGVHNWTTKSQPALHSTTMDFSLSELTKTYNWREFGNGCANQGTNTSGSLQDNSMLQGQDYTAFCMDDGLTEIHGNGSASVGKGNDQSYNLWSWSGDRYRWGHFIGTGLSIRGGYNGSTHQKDYYNLAQNMPYGTHQWYINNSSVVYIDGIALTSSGHKAAYVEEIHIYQPKMPPIPADAVIIADYMLMADFVPDSGGPDNSHVSKGVRKQSITRDILFNGDQAHSLGQDGAGEGGWSWGTSSAASNTNTTLRLSSFGTNFVKRSFHDRTVPYIGSTSQSGNKSSGTGSAGWADFSWLTNSQSLGVHQFGVNSVQGVVPNTTAFEIATPTHTSSHYQEFETPVAYELLGGDRNMEQTNLVVTADGKTWDQHTRNTSYMGPKYQYSTIGSDGGSGHWQDLCDNYRGTYYDLRNCTKGFILSGIWFMVKEGGWYDIAGTMRFDAGTERWLSLYEHGDNHMIAWVGGDHNGADRDANTMAGQLYLHADKLYRFHCNNSTKASSLNCQIHARWSGRNN